MQHSGFRSDPGNWKSQPVGESKGESVVVSRRTSNPLDVIRGFRVPVKQKKAARNFAKN